MAVGFSPGTLRLCGKQFLRSCFPYNLFLSLRLSVSVANPGLEIRVNSCHSRKFETRYLVSYGCLSQICEICGCGLALRLCASALKNSCRRDASAPRATAARHTTDGTPRGW
jgi:hypothetical protein